MKGGFSAKKIKKVYECSDSKYVAVGAIEPQFFAKLLEGLKIPLDDDIWSNQLNTALWPQQKRQLAQIFRSKTQVIAVLFCSFVFDMLLKGRVVQDI